MIKSQPSEKLTVGCAPLYLILTNYYLLLNEVLYEYREIELTEESKIEPNFQFCWALSWRLICLSVLIGIVPLAAANLCIGVAGAAMPSVINVLLLVLANFAVVLVSFSLS